MLLETPIDGFTLRAATLADVGAILGFITELAVYEKLEHEVVATEAILTETLFGPTPYAQVMMAELEGVAVGYALFFHNFSTFTGRPGIYLEDLYVQPDYRGRGFGKLLLAYLARKAVDMNCTRVEWSVLDWNQPAIDFYRSIGAQPMDGWTVQRLDGDRLAKFAKEFVG
ncbi:MAG: GNAT family N-acetyltransferase [Gammaproteobacteria bacterium]|jgi:GNAT superfamily N-acetyltransferase|nr:GNAT family N-acetyltransferase [Gammaproteobacteria bacterium]